MEAADAAIAKYPFIDASRQVAGGASYGGHLANALEETLVRHALQGPHRTRRPRQSETQWGTSDTIYGRELAMNGPVWEQSELEDAEPGAVCRT